MPDLDPLKIAEGWLKTYADAIPLYDDERRLVARALIAARQRIAELEAPKLKDKCPVCGEQGCSNCDINLACAEIARLRGAILQALEHVCELRSAWKRGCLSETDGKGGTRSNRNVEVEVKLRAALARPVNRSQPCPICENTPNWAKTEHFPSPPCPLCGEALAQPEPGKPA